MGRSWCQLHRGFRIFGFKVMLWPVNYFAGLACNASLLSYYCVVWWCCPLSRINMKDIVPDAQELNIRVENLVDHACE